MKNKYKWGQTHIFNFYNNNRNSWGNLYKGEKKIIRKIFKQNSSILDIGCAQGGLSAALTKISKNFTYTGIDYNSSMINKAKKTYPKHKFFKIKNLFITKKFKKEFDIVFILGILHLNRNWKKILLEAYNLSKKYLVFDLREINDVKIKKKIYQNLNLGKKSLKKNNINYYIRERRKIKKFFENKFKEDKIEFIEYSKHPSEFTNYKKPIMFSTYLISKKQRC